MASGFSIGVSIFIFVILFIMIVMCFIMESNLDRVKFPTIRKMAMGVGIAMILVWIIAIGIIGLYSRYVKDKEINITNIVSIFLSFVILVSTAVMMVALYNLVTNDNYSGGNKHDQNAFVYGLIAVALGIMSFTVIIFLAIFGFQRLEKTDEYAKLTDSALSDQKASEVQIRRREAAQNQYMEIGQNKAVNQLEGQYRNRIDDQAREIERLKRIAGSSNLPALPQMQI